MRQTSAKCSLGGCEATFALTSPQITLCCRLLHWSGCFNRNPAELTECSRDGLSCSARCPSFPTVQERKGRHARCWHLRIIAAARAAHLVGLAAQECRDIEQV